MNSDLSYSLETPDWNASTSVSTIELWLVQSIALLLDVPPTTVDVTARFVELGLDSVMALSVAGELELASGLCFTTSLLTNHDNPRALALFVVQQLEREGTQV